MASSRQFEYRLCTKMDGTNPSPWKAVIGYSPLEKEIKTRLEAPLNDLSRVVLIYSDSSVMEYRLAPLTQTKPLSEFTTQQLIKELNERLGEKFVESLD